MYLTGSPKPITGYKIEIDIGGIVPSRSRVTIRLMHMIEEVATFGFVDDGVPTPMAKIAAGRPSGTLPMACYLPMIDMLRNEKPIEAYVVGGTKKPDGSVMGVIIVVRSQNEIVGEAEAAPTTAKP